MNPLRQVDVVVLGGGAAGLFCALTAGQRRRSVVVLDHCSQVGEKIRISGGGRCNFTNLDSGARHYVSANGNFAISALSRFTPHHFIALLEKHGIHYFDKGGGQLFCTGSARQVVDMLVKECQQAGVTFYLPTTVQGVKHQAEHFFITTPEMTWQCQSLVVATGGKSYVQLGASDYGMQLARSFGLSLIATRPGLVPLVFGDWQKSPFASLTGISLQAGVSFGQHHYRDGILFTHRGLSGPAILQISSHWQEGRPICLNLLPDVDLFAQLKTARQGGRELLATLSHSLPRRLVEILVRGHGNRLADMNDEKLTALVQTIQNRLVIPSGHQGYAKAEVTVGGVDTACLSSKTMACTKLPNLFFIGEVVDVTGELGGYNLQWAWSSGHAAGCFA